MEIVECDKYKKQLSRRESFLSISLGPTSDARYFLSKLLK